ncbi:MAG: RecX family transcriptional regulator [Chitinivibrionia bacterium]|nr:RecX family transcriptional regulator [Chitinivibrionia bacterium]
MAETIARCGPRPRSRFYILLSGGRSFVVPEGEAAGFRPGMELPEDEIARLERTDQYLRGKEKALRLLAIRSRSKHEMESALAALRLDPGVERGIMQELIDCGLVDDLRFAREFVRAKTELKNHGPHRLRGDLKRSGVARSVIDRAIGECCAAESQEELAWRAARRKMGTGVPDVAAVKRVSDYLKRKGFDFDVVHKVVFELLKRAGAEETGD